MNLYPNFRLLGTSGHGKLFSVPRINGIIAIHSPDNYTDYILPDEGVTETEAVTRYVDICHSHSRSDYLYSVVKQNDAYFLSKS